MLCDVGSLNQSSHEKRANAKCQAVGACTLHMVISSKRVAASSCGPPLRRAQEGVCAFRAAACINMLARSAAKVVVQSMMADAWRFKAKSQA